MRKLTLICAIVATIVGVVVVAVPPYRTYTSGAIVQSVIAEAIVPTDSRPDVEWKDGARRLWRSQPAEVRFYGIEEAEVQNHILESFRKHLAESDHPGIAVRFFPKGRTSAHPVEAMRSIFIQR